MCQGSFQDDEEKRDNKCPGCTEHGCLFKKPEDLKKVAAGLGFRFLYSLLTVFILGFGANESATSFMSSSMLYSFPLIREYWAFEPKQKLRVCFRRAQIGLLGMMIFLAALYLFNILVGITIDEVIYITINPEWVINPNIKVSVRWLWYVQLITAVFTGLDWIIYKPQNKVCEYRTEASSDVAR